VPPLETISTSSSASARAARSIATPPADAKMAATIESFVGRADPAPVSQFVAIGGEQVFRTVYPSIAREHSCVDCHNKLQPDLHWQLYDVMGAFSIASILGVPAGLELARRGGWRLPFIAVGVLGAAASIFFAYVGFDAVAALAE